MQSKQRLHQTYLCIQEAGFHAHDFEINATVDTLQVLWLKDMNLRFIRKLKTLYCVPYVFDTATTTGGDWTATIQAFKTWLMKLPGAKAGDPTPAAQSHSAGVRRATMHGPKIFVSHSSKDVHLVKALRTWLLQCFSINVNDLYISSLAGNGTQSGVSIKEDIQRNLNSAELILYFISPNFLTSAVCNSELGYGMANKSKQKLFFLRLDNVNVSELNIMIDHHMVAQASKRAHLLEFAENVSTLLGATIPSIAALSDFTDDFLSELQRNSL